MMASDEDIINNLDFFESFEMMEEESIEMNQEDTITEDYDENR